MLAIATMLPNPVAASGEGGVVTEIKQIVIRADEAVEGKPGEWKLTSKGEIISDVVDGVDRVDKNGVYDNGSATSKNNPYDKRPIRDR